MAEKSYGQKAVGMDFNPSGDANVRLVKEAYAEVIDLLNDMRSTNEASAELKRNCSLAITHAQTAQMWAVKAITWRY